MKTTQDIAGIELDPARIVEDAIWRGIETGIKRFERRDYQMTQVEKLKIEVADAILDELGAILTINFRR